MLFICESSSFAGVERYVLNLGTALSAYRDISVHYALCYRGPLKEKLGKMGVTNLIDLHGRKNMKSIGAIIKYVRKHHIDLLHFVDVKSTNVGCLASYFLRDIQVVATTHGLPEETHSWGKRIKVAVTLSAYYFFLRFFVDGIICVSHDLANRLRHRIGLKRVHIIHNGLNVADFHERKISLMPPKDCHIIGTVGRIDRVKGYEYLLESFRKMLLLRDDLVLHIIGQGPLEQSLKEKSKLLGIAGKTHFLGFRENINALLSDMDIFVLPSLHEGIPYALLEAMALCRPVVCSNVGGIKEVIEDHFDGILVPPKDSEALRDGISNLIEDRNKARQLGVNARKKIEAQFSVQAMAGDTYALYRKLIDTHRIYPPY